MATLRAAGSSTSATPGTVVAEVERTGSNQLVHWWVHTGQTSTANTQTRIVITYTDASTTTFDTAASTGGRLFGNGGGIFRTANGTPNLIQALDAKAVRKVSVQTLGTGTGTRYGAISAEEAP